MTETTTPAPRITYTIGQGEEKYELEQLPLSFMAKLELVSVVGATLDRVLEDGKVSIADLTEIPAGRGNADVDMADAETFVRAAAKLATLSPGFISEAFCIILNVPAHQRDHLASLMKRPVEQGGLGDEDAVKIIDTFKEQNGEAMKDLWDNQLKRLFAKAQAQPKKRAPRNG